MKTKEIIQRLRNMRGSVSDLRTLKLATERLEELSTGYYSVSAEVAKKIYTIHELARMYDIRLEYTQELYDENKRLKAEIARLKGEKE